MDRLRKCGSVRVSLTIEGKGLFSTEHTLAQCACTRAGHDPVWFENMHAFKCAGSPLLVRCRPVQAEHCSGGRVCVNFQTSCSTITVGVKAAKQAESSVVLLQGGLPT